MEKRDKIELMNQKGVVPLIIIVIATLVIGVGAGGFLLFPEKTASQVNGFTENAKIYER